LQYGVDCSAALVGIDEHFTQAAVTKSAEADGESEAAVLNLGDVMPASARKMLAAHGAGLHETRKRRCSGPARWIASSRRLRRRVIAIAVISSVPALLADATRRPRFDLFREAAQLLRRTRGRRQPFCPKPCDRPGPLPDRPSRVALACGHF